MSLTRPNADKDPDQIHNEEEVYSAMTKSRTANIWIAGGKEKLRKSKCVKQKV